MALQGTLRDFSIAEIFQLIGQQQKTGMLTVTRDKQVVHVIFDQGRVVGAAEGDHGEDDRLADRLERMGLLSEERIRELRSTQRGSLRRIGPVLAEEGTLAKEALTEILRVEMINVVLGLFRWENGNYEFCARKVRFEPEFAIGVPAEHVLLDGLRAKDEWPSIDRSLPTLSAVPERTGEPPATEGEEGGVEPEQAVYDLIDGKRSIRAIIDESRMGEFEACRILANLKARGYIQLASRGGLIAPPKGWRENPPSALAACVAAVVGCGLLAGSLLGPVIGKLPGDAGPVIGGSDIAAVMIENRRSRIREALEIYRIERGRYPAQLDELVTSGLLRSGDVLIPLHYEGRAGSYALL